MASKKKKIQVTVELKTREELNEYLAPTYPKVVVVDGFHPFWGRCEVAEIMLKKFQEEPANANKVDWLSIPYEQITDIRIFTYILHFPDGSSNMKGMKS